MSHIPSASHMYKFPLTTISKCHHCAVFTALKSLVFHLSIFPPFTLALPGPWVVTACITVPLVLSLLEYHRIASKQHITFSYWFLSFGNMHLKWGFSVLFLGFVYDIFFSAVLYSIFYIYQSLFTCHSLNDIMIASKFGNNKASMKILVQVFVYT